MSARRCARRARLQSLARSPPRRAPRRGRLRHARHVRRLSRASTCARRPAGASRCSPTPRAACAFRAACSRSRRAASGCVDMGSWEPGRGRLLRIRAAGAPGGARAARVHRARRQARPPARPRARPRRPRLARRGRPDLAHADRRAGARRAAGDGDRRPARRAARIRSRRSSSAPHGQLYVNVGSASDACRDDAGAQPMPCPEPRGRRRAPRSTRRRSAAPASRCSRCGRSRAACATRSRSPSCAGPDVLLQGENSIDYRDEAAPPEELNVLRDGAHYGWPYCVGARAAARGYEGRFDCAQTEPPALLWPAHAAPLQMLAVPAGANNAFAGQLLVAWHGYRAGRAPRSSATRSTPRAGRRARRKVWVDGWTAAAPACARSARRPASPSTRAGRLLIVEDRHKTLLDARPREGPLSRPRQSLPCSNSPFSRPKARPGAAGSALQPRHGRDAGLHAGRHLRQRQGRDAGVARGDGRRDHPRQHLPPVAAARARRAAHLRRPASLRGLDRGRSSPTAAASRSGRSAPTPRSASRASPSSRRSTATSCCSRPRSACRSSACSTATSSCSSTSAPPGRSRRRGRARGGRCAARWR